MKARSTPLEPRERAIALAHELADKGDTVLRLEGPSGDVTAEEIGNYDLYKPRLPVVA